MRIHGLLWLAATIVVFLFSPLVMRPADYERTLATEIEGARAWYSDAEVERIMRGGDAIYRSLMVSTGIDPAIRKFLVPQGPASRELAPGMQIPADWARWADGLAGYWDSFLLNIRLFCFRLAHSGIWFQYLLPFLAAITFDGVMTRNAKLESFRYTSPTVYNLSWHLIIAILCFSFVYFAIGSPIATTYFPAVVTAVGVCVRLLIGNIQHSA